MHGSDANSKHGCDVPHGHSGQVHLDGLAPVEYDALTTQLNPAMFGASNPGADSFPNKLSLKFRDTRQNMEQNLLVGDALSVSSPWDTAINLTP